MPPETEDRRMIQLPVLSSKHQVEDSAYLSPAPTVWYSLLKSQMEEHDGTSMEAEKFVRRAGAVIMALVATVPQQVGSHTPVSKEAGAKKALALSLNSQPAPFNIVTSILKVAAVQRVSAPW